MREAQELKLGVAPTRRVIFSIEDAARQKCAIHQKLAALGVPFVNIDGVNDEGLVFDRTHVPWALEILRREGVDALFIPHVNFGTEDAIARVARDLGKPVLLWGPRDRAPRLDGSREGDTQCGLFATSKILRRMGVPFSYIVNSRIDDEVFERGLGNFLGAAAAVKAFRGARIGQVSTRPAAFWTMMVNEGELLERWGVEVMLQEAIGRVSAVFFADLTIRHPSDDNAELLFASVNRLHALLDFCSSRRVRFIQSTSSA